MSLIASSPDLLLYTLLAGILLIYTECNRPGWVIPGCLGCILTLFSLHALSLFPLAAPGAGLAVLGMVCLAVAILVSKPALPTILGALLLGAGAETLIQPMAVARVHLPAAAVFACGFALSTVWLGRIARRARRNKLAAGTDGAAGVGCTG